MQFNSTVKITMPVFYSYVYEFYLELRGSHENAYFIEHVQLKQTFFHLIRVFQLGIFRNHLRLS